MDYLNAAWTGAPVQVPVSDRLNLPGQWVSIPFDHEYADAGGHHSGSGVLIATGPRYVHGVLDARFEDFAPGTEIQIRQQEVDTAGVAVETDEPHEFYTSQHPVPVDENGDPLYPARTHHRYPVFSYINSGHRLRLQVSQWPADLDAPAGVIAWAQIRLLLEAP